MIFLKINTVKKMPRGVSWGALGAPAPRVTKGAQKKKKKNKQRERRERKEKKEKKGKRQEGWTNREKIER